ncbi:MAG: GNAT family N-acetyltransferase [Solirubrobacteraceae bacterium]
MSPVVIRRAQSSDRDRLWPLVQDFAASFARERSAFDRSFDALIARADTLLVVAELPGSVIAGYLLASHHGTLFANAPVAWVEEIMVAAPARRSGIGRALMAEARDFTYDHARRAAGMLATSSAGHRHDRGCRTPGSPSVTPLRGEATAPGYAAIASWATELVLL